MCEVKKLFPIQRYVTLHFFSVLIVNLEMICLTQGHSLYKSYLKLQIQQVTLCKHI